MQIKLFFQQEENVLALKTKHWGIVLVSSMAGFWTQFNDTQFLWCLSTIFSCDCFLLRLQVTRGLRHLQPHPPGWTQRKRTRASREVLRLILIGVASVMCSRLMIHCCQVALVLGQPLTPRAYDSSWGGKIFQMKIGERGEAGESVLFQK